MRELRLQDGIDIETRTSAEARVEVRIGRAARTHCYPASKHRVEPRPQPVQVDIVGYLRDAHDLPEGVYTGVGPPRTDRLDTLDAQQSNQGCVDLALNRLKSWLSGEPPKVGAVVGDVETQVHFSAPSRQPLSRRGPTGKLPRLRLRQTTLHRTPFQGSPQLPKPVRQR